MNAIVATLAIAAILLITESTECPTCQSKYSQSSISQQVYLSPKARTYICQERLEILPENSQPYATTTDTDIS